MVISKRERFIPKRFAILDRDGTIIVEKNYLSSPEGVELLPGAVEGLRRLAELGWGRIVVTNQSGVGRGYFDQASVDAVHQRVRELLAAGGADIEAFYVCPHSPEEGCACRKPRTALVLQAAAEWNFAPEHSVVIGDKSSDIRLGKELGIPTILVLTGYGETNLQEGLVQPDFVVQDLREAAAVVSDL